MAMLIAYEVQTFEGGSWQIASMFDDKELALIEARRLEEGLRRRETRVVEETHDEESRQTKSKVVYTSPKIRPAGHERVSENTASRPGRKEEATRSDLDLSEAIPDRRCRHDGRGASAPALDARPALEEPPGTCRWRIGQGARRSAAPAVTLD